MYSTEWDPVEAYDEGLLNSETCLCLDSKIKCTVGLLIGIAVASGMCSLTSVLEMAISLKEILGETRLSKKHPQNLRTPREACGCNTAWHPQAE